MQTSKPSGADEQTRVLEIMRAAFGDKEEYWQGFAELVTADNFRVVRDNEKLAGGLALLRMGQFFGGRSIPMVGISAVAVAPEHRGGGAATALMCDTVRDLHAEGVPLSALYPATEPLYRRAGYEQAGVAFQTRLSLGSIRIRDRGLPVKPIGDEDMDLVKEIYLRRAQGNPGNLDRSDYNWYEIRHRAATGYLIGESGYAFYKETKLPGELRMVLHVIDHAAVTAPAVRRLLTFLADHSSTREDVLLLVGPSDPLLAVVPEQRYKPRYLDHWMLRVVHLPAALEARGYNAGTDVELHLAVSDDIVEQNAGAWTVRIADGSARVEAGGRGELRLDVRALASLYSGHLSVATLRAAGWVEGPENALAAAQTAFAGPAPWMSDGF